MDGEILDGNVLAGALSSLFRPDPTTLRIECGGCAAVTLLAETLVERDESAAIVCCRSCTHTLFTVLDEPDGVRIVIESLRSLGGRT